jgi:hypothetical protein
MRRRTGERGENNLGCLLWILLAMAVGFVLYKAIPVKMKIVQLYDHAEELAQYSGRLSGEQIKKAFVEKAKDLGLPVDPKRVMVDKRKERIKIRYSFTVPIKFPGYTWEWKVEREVERQIFYL